jgi:mRNA-degrading endonuclease toxin of MazEF toxin-antitoxin module
MSTIRGVVPSTMRYDVNYTGKGNLWYVKLPRDKHGSVQSGRRPCVVCQSNFGMNSPILIVAPVSSADKKAYPFLQEVTNVNDLASGETWDPSSKIHFEQLISISRAQLDEYIGKLSSAQKIEMDLRLAVPLDLVKSSYLHINRVKVYDKCTDVSKGTNFKGRVYMEFFTKSFSFSATEFLAHFGPEYKYYLESDYASLSELLETLKGLKFLYHFIDRNEER